MKSATMAKASPPKPARRFAKRQDFGGFPADAPLPRRLAQSRGRARADLRRRGHVRVGAGRCRLGPRFGRAVHARRQHPPLALEPGGSRLPDPRRHVPGVRRLPPGARRADEDRPPDPSRQRMGVQVGQCHRHRRWQGRRNGPRQKRIICTKRDPRSSRRLVHRQRVAIEMVRARPQGRNSKLFAER